MKSLAEYLRTKFTGDEALRMVRVRGEVSNRSTSARGHLNFVLKEGDAVLACFAWEDDFLRFPAFDNGAAIVVTGAVTTYPQRSTYQLVARGVELGGVGDIQRIFDERKRRLAAEGLFDIARKRPLPEFPFRVALVSSRRADGAIDFATRLRRKRPHVRVFWCETSVQGPNAAHEIVGALARAGLLDVDVVLVTRGGGSFEDLFVFSDEGVVRAIRRCPHPVVSAVGHTVDQQLCDFAADLHAETPSAAAESMGPETVLLERRIRDDHDRARRSVAGGIERRRWRLGAALTRSKLDDAALFLVPQVQRLESLDDRRRAVMERALERRLRAIADLTARLGRCDPSRRLAQRRLALQAARLTLEANVRRRLSRETARLSALTTLLDPAAHRVREAAAARLRVAVARLEGKDPETILQRGYAIVTHGGAIVRDAESVPLGATIDARVARGSLSARVETKKAHGHETIG